MISILVFLSRGWWGPLISPDAPVAVATTAVLTPQTPEPTEPPEVSPEPTEVVQLTPTAEPTALAQMTREPGTGDVQVTLTWQSRNDLDLWVTDPSGETIYYGHRVSASGGRLDLDANPGCASPTESPIENIFWPPGGAPSGDFVVSVVYYRECDPPQSATAYNVRLSVDGRVTMYDGVLNRQSEQSLVATFRR